MSLRGRPLRAPWCCVASVLVLFPVLGSTLASAGAVPLTPSSAGSAYGSIDDLYPVPAGVFVRGWSRPPSRC